MIVARGLGRGLGIIVAWGYGLVLRDVVVARERMDVFLKRKRINVFTLRKRLDNP